MASRRRRSATRAVYIGDLGGLVHAVNIADGKALWTYRTASEIKSSPVVADGAVLVGSYDGSLYAFEPMSGQAQMEGGRPTEWCTPRRRSRTGWPSSPAATRSCARSASPTARKPIAIDSGAYTGASPLIDGTRAYFGTFNNEVLAFDLQRRTHALALCRSPNGDSRSIPQRHLANGRIILGGRDKSIHAIDAKTGKAAWTFATRARVDSSPVIVDGRVYVGSSDGRLYVLDAASGKKLWEFDAGSALTASPAVAAGRLVIGSQDGRVYVLG